MKPERLNRKVPTDAECQDRVATFFKARGKKMLLQRGRCFEPVAQGLYFIQRGSLKLIREDSSGKQLAFLLSVGEVAGLTGFLQDPDPGFQAWSLESGTILLFVARKEVMDEMEAHPLFSLCLIRLAGKHLNQVLSVASEILVFPARQRLAKTILGIIDKFGSNAEGKIDLRLSAEDLSSMVGISKTTMYRLLKDLTRQGVLETKGKAIRVCDFMQLERLSMV